MAKKAAGETAVKRKTPAKPEPAGATPVRNSSIPKVAARASTASATLPSASPVVTREMIAERAYHISMSGTGGSEFDNWLRAEHELRSERGA